MLPMLHALATFVADLFKPRGRLEVENLFLRHQLNVAMSALTQVVVFLSNERIAIFFQFAVRLIAGFAAAAVSPVSAQSVEPTLACVAPPGFARFDTPLERVAARISARQPITIVAIGSSSTFGTDASSPAMSYPSRLAVELRD
jgi:hypothetical protein